MSETPFFGLQPLAGFQLTRADVREVPRRRARDAEAKSDKQTISESQQAVNISRRMSQKRMSIVRARDLSLSFWIQSA